MICLLRVDDSFEDPGLSSLAVALSAWALGSQSWQLGDTGLSELVLIHGVLHYAWKGSYDQVQTWIILFIRNNGSIYWLL